MNIRGKEYIYMVIILIIFTGIKSLRFNNDYDGYVPMETSDYSIDMIVTEDRRIKVTERISVKFLETGHGIYRKIPFKGEIDIDSMGSVIKHKYFMKIKNIDVENESFSTSIKGDELIIKAGKKDHLISGDKNYVLHYEYVLPEDDIGAMDYLFINMIPRWSTPIGGGSIQISMPKDIKDGQIYFQRLNKQRVDDISYSVNGNTINASILNPIKNSKDIYLGIELNDGYFTGEKLDNRIIAIGLLLAMSIIFITIVFLIRKNFGQDTYITGLDMELETYPPDNISSLEVLIAFEEKIKYEFLFSIILHWAQEGYIKIVEWSEGNLRLVKVAELPSAKPKHEKFIFKKLFKNSMKRDMGVFTEEFYNYKDEMISILKRDVRRKFTNEFMDETCRTAKRIVDGLTIVSFISFLIMGYFIFPQEIYSNKSLSVLIMVTTIFILRYVGSNMNKMNFKGNIFSCKLDRFRNFICNASVDDIKEICLRDKDYFYENLPYVYIFNIEDIWTNVYEELRLEKPHWFFTNVYREYEKDFTPFRILTDIRLLSKEGEIKAVREMNEKRRRGRYHGGGGGFSGGGCSGSGGGGW